MYVSASEIAAALKTGKVHIGVTGEDLVREQIVDADKRLQFCWSSRLGFGFADVVVAVPACWIDVATVGDLEAAACTFRRAHRASAAGGHQVHEHHAAVFSVQRLRRLSHR